MVASAPFVSAMHLQPRHAEPLALRLYHPTDAEIAAVETESRLPIVSPRMTLPEFSNAYYVTHVLSGKNRSPRTIDEINCSLKLWASLTGNPPIGLIDDFTVEAFKQRLAEPITRVVGRLRKTIRLSPATIRKHCAQLAPVIRATGPRRPWNKRGAAVVTDPPEIELPSAGDVLPIDAPNLDALDAIFRACGTAEVPRLDWIDAPTWWRALLVCCYETALRIGSLIYTDWHWLRGDHRGLSLHVPGRRYKGGRGRVFPVNDVAASWFDVIRQAQKRAGVLENTPHADSVFRWPHDPLPDSKDPREHNDDFSYLQATRRKIFAAAGVKIVGGFHALRRANATLRPLVDIASSQRALGHSQSRTTQQSYIGESVARAIVDGLPQPTSFLPPSS